MQSAYDKISVALSPAYLKKIEDARSRDQSDEPYGLEHAIFHLESALINLNQKMAQIKDA